MAVISVRVSEEERETLETEASRLGVSISSLMRQRSLGPALMDDFTKSALAALADTLNVPEQVVLQSAFIRYRAELDAFQEVFNAGPTTHPEWTYFLGGERLLGHGLYKVLHADFVSRFRWMKEHLDYDSIHQSAPWKGHLLLS